MDVCAWPHPDQYGLLQANLSGLDDREGAKRAEPRRRIAFRFL